MMLSCLILVAGSPSGSSFYGECERICKAGSTLAGSQVVDTIKSIQVLQLGKPVDVLINNAGIMFGPRKETQEVKIQPD